MMFGTWTKSSSPSPARNIGCGGLSTRMDMFSMRSSKTAAIKAAKRLLTRLKKQGLASKRMITDKLRSYGAAKRQGHAGCRALRAQGPQQQGREFPPAAAKAGADDAGLPFARRPAALRLDLLSLPKSLRPGPLKTTLRISDPSPSPQRYGRMESYDPSPRLISLPAVLHVQPQIT